ncbi:MAG TPA: multicopper oxidase domain-containing protein [Chitinophagaceae bacterium]|nr:multicopper oxidase domain-containing protein [Chitinophagaceae bacterium]
MKRRDFFSLVSGGLGATAFISCSKEFLNEPSLVSAARPGGGGGGTVTRYPLEIPGTVSPNDLTLDCKTATTNIGPSKLSNVWCYNGDYPAKSIVARKGDMAMITLQNHLSEHTITHWHGLIVDPHNDGGPMHHIATGETYNYHFEINQRAGLNWYHPHPHMLTGKQVNLGMAGAFIIRDSEEDALGLPVGEYEIPLIIRDVTIDKNGNITYKPTSGGFNGQAPMVNGTLSPYVDVRRTVYRFRILNGANSRIFGLAMSDGRAMRLIGNDGGLLPTSSDQTRMDISPAERLDVLVDFRGLASGTKIYLRDQRAGWDLLEFRVTGNSDMSYNFPSINQCSITPLSSPVTTRVFSFDGMTKINGLEYSMDRIDWQVPFGETERWIFKTNGNAPHPVHIHGASFQVISRTGGRGRTYPWEAGWKDTVLLEDSETVEVFIRFDGFRGMYLMHCHKLEHEDLGMMANFEVI